MWSYTDVAEQGRTYNGGAITGFRESRHLNRTNFAAAVGISTPHLSNIEADRRQPSETLANKMCIVLGLRDMRWIIREKLDAEIVPVWPEDEA